MFYPILVPFLHGNALHCMYIHPYVGLYIGLSFFVLVEQYTSYFSQSRRQRIVAMILNVIISGNALGPEINNETMGIAVKHSPLIDNYISHFNMFFLGL